MSLDLLKIPGPARDGLVPQRQKSAGPIALSCDGKRALPRVPGPRRRSVATTKPQLFPAAAVSLAPARLGESLHDQDSGPESFSMRLSGRYKVQNMWPAYALRTCGARN